MACSLTLSAQDMAQGTPTAPTASAPSAQGTSASTHEEPSIHINTRFLQELDHTFSLAPREAPIEAPQEEVLTREQLHAWVGKPRLEVPKVEIPELRDGAFARGIQLWRSQSGRYSMLNTQEGRQVLSGFDVNALGKYIRPKEIRLRRMQELADRYRATMDKFFPREGVPLWSREDAARVDSMQIVQK